MKTLAESIVNELRLSKVSTGDKLIDKTFADLKEGDKLYFAFPQFQYISVTTIKKIVHSNSEHCYKFFYETDDDTFKTFIYEYNMKKEFASDETLPNCFIAANLNVIYKEIADSEKYEFTK